MQKSGQKENKIIYVAIAMLGLVLVSFWLLCNMYAKYTSAASGSDSARVALWGTNESIQLADEEKLPALPGDSCTYTLAVTNEQNGKISEVTQNYSIEVMNAGNLPLTYTLLKDDKEISTYTESAKENTWKISDDNMTFQAGTRGEHIYKLKVEWPKDQNSATLAGVPDYIQINICVEQED